MQQRQPLSLETVRRQVEAQIGRGLRQAAEREFVRLNTAIPLPQKAPEPKQ